MSRRLACRRLAMAMTALVVLHPTGGDGQTPRETPLGRFAELKAEALLRQQLPCLGCHQYGTEGGRLAPDLATVAQRRDRAYIAAIVADPERVVPGTIMPRTAMPVGTRDLLVRFLASRGDGARATPAASAPPAISASSSGTTRDARTLYASRCAACHGAAGKGDGPNARHLPVPPAAHSSREAMSARSDDALFDTIASGGLVMNRSPRMPAFGGSLTPDEVQSLVRYIRELCDCQGPAWSRDGGRR
jgi:mono/diheme cytochrome c family protein